MEWLEYLVCFIQFHTTHEKMSFLSKFNMEKNPHSEKKQGRIVHIVYSIMFIWDNNDHDVIYVYIYSMYYVLSKGEDINNITIINFDCMYDQEKIHTWFEE